MRFLCNLWWWVVLGLLLSGAGEWFVGVFLVGAIVFGLAFVLPYVGAILNPFGDDRDWP